MQIRLDNITYDFDELGNHSRRFKTGRYANIYRKIGAGLFRLYLLPFNIIAEKYNFIENTFS